MKLYLVTLCGLFSTPYHSSYVVAKDPTAAYTIVREYLEKKDFGFNGDRELKKVELVADDVEYPDTTNALFHPDRKEAEHE